MIRFATFLVLLCALVLRVTEAAQEARGPIANCPRILTVLDHRTDHYQTFYRTDTLPPDHTECQ